VDESQALAEIKRLTMLRRVSLTAHAKTRMRERGVTVRDLLAAIISATTARHEDEHKYRVEGGIDEDGDPLTIVVAIEADLLVITIF